MESNMTHYMELLVSNQPWNLILFMAIPVILAEFIAITELFILFKQDLGSSWKTANKIASIIAGVYFFGVFIYLFTTAVIPLTTSGGWRGAFDVIAVGFYLLGVIPLGGMALLELGVIAPKANGMRKMGIHATFVGIFLVVAHVAMIFGMLQPGLASMPM